MAHLYKLWLSVEYDQLVPDIKKMTDSINEHIEKMGLNEKIHLRGKAVSLVIRSEKKLRQKEKQRVSEIVLNVFSKELPQYKWMTEEMEYEGETNEEGGSEHQGTHEEIPF